MQPSFKSVKSVESVAAFAGLSRIELNLVLADLPFASRQYPALDLVY
jgi:hypothetical protein